MRATAFAGPPSLAAAFLVCGAGCASIPSAADSTYPAHTHYVAVSRPWAAKDPLEALRRSAARSLYVAVEDVEIHDEPDGMLRRWLAIRETRPKVDADLLAREVAKALQAAGAASIIFRASRDGAADPYPALLQPDAVLRLTPRLETTLQDRPKVPAWAITARLTIDGDLAAWPIVDPIRRSTFSETAAISGVYSAAPIPRDWFHENEWPLLSGIARRVASRVRPSRCSQIRPIFVRPFNRRSVQGWQAAVDQRWDDAERSWRLEADRGDWQAAWNLGVSSELRGEFERARAFYEKVRDGVEPPELEGTDWGRLISELKPPPGPNRDFESARSSWFSRRLAVLPFTDQTASVDGPIVTRALVSALLRNGGYSTIPVGQVDYELRDRGISQGGHLKTVNPADLAAWLKADVLVFGDIDRYQTLPISTVSGELSFWDSSSGTGPAMKAAATELPYSDAIAKLRDATGASWPDTALLPVSETLWFAQRALGSVPKTIEPSTAAASGHAARCAEDFPRLPPPHLEGTVTYLKFEGGFFGIIGEDGSRYDPFGLPQQFQQDGLRIRFRVRKQEDQGSIRMWGEVVEVYDVEPL